MMLIPAVIEGDIALFTKGIDFIQTRRWKAFEIESQDLVVAQIISNLRQHGLSAGMSSWGSTVFALGSKLNDPDFQEQILQGVRNIMNQHSGGVCSITRANNSGHRLVRAEDRKH